MLFQNQLQSKSFQEWVLKENKNMQLIWLFGAAVITQFCIFKVLYPYPNFITDSRTYMLAAINNQSISRFPIGYSKFLRLISGFTSSHLVLILLQYVLLQASILYFLMSVGYLLSLNKWIYRFLVIASSLNPLLFYISNLISADALFTALSVIWFTQLLWVLYRPTLRLLLLHSITLLLALMMRYESLYYPIISLSIILIARLPKKPKAISITCIALSLSAYFISASFEYKKLTGKTMFLPAAGWQIAGNALAAYEQSPEGYIKSSLPDRYTKLQLAISQHLDSTGPIVRYIHRHLSYSYQFEQSSPLYTYMRAHLPRDSTTTPLKQWAEMANFYGDYGWRLIEQHPGSYFKYFLLRNLRYFYTPGKEFLETYNMDKDTIDAIAVYWFELKNNKVVARNKNLQIATANISQIAMALINLLFVLSFICTYALGGFSPKENYTKSVFRLVLLLWVSNFCFSVFAAPIVLRHQVFPIIISYTFGGLLISYIIEKAKFQNIRQPSQKKTSLVQKKMITPFNK